MTGPRLQYLQVDLAVNRGQPMPSRTLMTLAEYKVKLDGQAIP
jgi:hypothetical protein